MSTDHEMMSRPNTRHELMMIKKEATQGVKWLVGLTAMMWALELVDKLVLAHRLDLFGIRPRTLSGLTGILFAPWLHGGIAHIAANTLPFITLGALIWLRGRREWVAATLMSGLVGGLGIWLFGAANSIHVGASITIFGYLGYLLAVGIFERKISSILLSLFVMVFFGGALAGAVFFLVGPGISWEGHLFGLIGGVAAARMMREKPRRKALPA